MIKTLGHGFGPDNLPGTIPGLLLKSLHLLFCDDFAETRLPEAVKIR
jgi:hypothetical protein